MHYGVKGMKWGVRRNRPSKTQRDARKLADTATKYYEASNRVNANQDGGGFSSRDVDNMNKYHKETQRLVSKLNKKYGSVSAIPEFDKNGYVVKSVEATITKLDRQGRVRNVSKSSNPVETFDYEFGGPTGRAYYVKKQNEIKKEYNNKLKNAKDEWDRMDIEAEMENELDNIRIPKKYYH